MLRKLLRVLPSILVPLLVLGAFLALFKGALKFLGGFAPLKFLGGATAWYIVLSLVIFLIALQLTSLTIQAIRSSDTAKERLREGIKRAGSIISPPQLYHRTKVWLQALVKR